MDPRLLDYYNRELAYLRELGAEFADEFPKVAARLGMKGIEVADPYVERLLEGVAFLGARVQLKLDAEFPRFSQRLLEIVYPNYVAPTPAAAIVRLEPKLAEASLAAGYTVPAGTLLRSQVPKGEQTACEFRTAHPVTLWPLEIADVALTGVPPDLPLQRVSSVRPIRGALRIRVRAIGGVQLAQLALDRLTFFLSGTDETAAQLHELCLARACGVLVCAPERPAKWCEVRGADSIEAEGFAEDQALFPYVPRAFQGYRLLHEYFAFPQRFLFLSFTGLSRALASAAGDCFDLVVLFDRAVPELERVVDAAQLALYCTPAVNLFPRRSDRLQILPGHFEHHVVMDRARPRDFEVYAITQVAGHAPGESEAQVFRPLYGSVAEDGRGYGRYYSTRREPRLLSEQAARKGARTGYIGSEVFVALVDANEAPYAGELRQLTVEALCTNRDLPLLMPLGGRTDFTLAVAAPVERVRVVRGPSRPSPALADREITWRLISQLGLNYLTLTDLDATQGAASLRRLLELYAALSDAQTARQVEGVQGLALRPVTRKLPRPGPLVFGRGVELTLTLDENAFAGTGGFLLGMVLERFFARHVGINTFTETRVMSLQRGELVRWTPRPGARPVA